MTFTDQIAEAERRNDSLLCIGLDPDAAKFPADLRGDTQRIFDFCSAIVDATKDLAIAFKPQIAYFAAQRAEDQLEALIAHIHAVAPAVPVILDAKRGDIGSTAEQYAREAFERYRADALTLSPLMGFDSIEPYLAYPGKGLLLLCRTSNPGGADLQTQWLAASDRETGSGWPAGGAAPPDRLYERIARLANGPWNRSGQLGLVVGATFPDDIERVRAIAPTLPLLIPGIGTQGGDARATVQAGWRGDAGPRDGEGGAGGPRGRGPTTAPILVSSSRAVLYAGVDENFAAAARAAATAVRERLNAARRPG